MEYPVFRVYLGQTDAISNNLLLLNANEIEIANLAVLELLRNAVRDARKNRFQKLYSVAIENITVAAIARRSGKKLYIVLVCVTTNGDWDPDGGVGLDHIAYSRTHELAKAFATVIGGSVNFRWIRRPTLQLNDTAPRVPYAAVWDRKLVRTSVFHFSRSDEKTSGNVFPNVTGIRKSQNYLRAALLLKSDSLSPSYSAQNPKIFDSRSAHSNTQLCNLPLELARTILPDETSTPVSILGRPRKLDIQLQIGAPPITMNLNYRETALFRVVDQRALH